jgi:hypothetical protein
MKIPAVILSVGLIAGPPTLALADTASDLNNQVTTLNNTTTSQGQTNVINKISSDFSSFLGADAKAVVTGLRNGTPITLTSTTSTPTTTTTTTPTTTTGSLPTTTTTTTTITPPTGQIGFGGAFISLALAKQELSGLGITQPTPEQLKAALTGGPITQTTSTGATTTTTGTTAATTTTTQLQGILTMRSQNMGWGQIAQKLGFKLGPVIASMKSANHSLTSGAATSATGSNATNTGGQSTGSDNGIVSGSGNPHGNSNQTASSGKGASDGIVTASGRGNGNAYGLNRGSIVTGSGASSNGGIVSAGGGGSSNGAANGKGHTK